jgi:hypothetical protein
MVPLVRPSAESRRGVHAPGTDAVDADGRHWDPLDRLLISVLVVLLVVTQRLGFPLSGTSVPFALPIGYVLIGALVVRRGLVLSRLRAELLGLALTGCFITTVVVDVRGDELSITSLWLLVAIYLPWTLRAPAGAAREAAHWAGRTFVTVMLVVAGAGILQFLTQLAHVWRYEDYVGEWVPPDLLVPGFNTSYPVTYGSPVFKANGLLLVEPSMLSQFCALGVVIALVLRARAWKVLVLVAGLASAVSGTGVVLLVCAVAVMLLRAPRLLRPGYVITFGIALVLVFLSPVADLLLNRTTEISSQNSSGYSRFVAPYQGVYDALDHDPVRYLVGAGPGMAARLLGSGYDTTLYSTLPKLVFEYGVVAGGLFSLFLVVAMLDRGPWRVVPATVLIAVVFLQGGLLQPQTAFLAWALTCLGAREDLLGPQPAGDGAPAGERPDDAAASDPDQVLLPS